MSWWRTENGSEDCSNCDETGRTQCTTCGGDYKRQNDAGFWWKCTDCTEVTNTCWVCKGTGRRTFVAYYCNSCDTGVGGAYGCCPVCGAE